MSNTLRLNISAHDALRGGEFGNPQTALSEAIFGLHPLMLSMPIPINRDYHGITLFTRPQCNMMLENLRSVSKYSSLLSTDTRSVGRAIRAMLDPRLHYAQVYSDLVDPNNPFIPLMTNSLESASGFPDLEYQFYVSTPGIMGEVYGMVDSVSDQYASRSINTSFRNSAGSILIKLFDTWTSYASNVFTGNVVRYPDAIAENWNDSNTRIWRLVMDNTKTYVQHLGCTIASSPQGVSYGRFFDFDRDLGSSEAQKEISMSWMSFGVIYDEPELVWAFNHLVETFHTGMTDKNRETVMQRLTLGEYNLLRCRCYPRIHPDSYKLEWWVDKAIYVQHMNFYANRKRILVGA